MMCNDWAVAVKQQHGNWLVSSRYSLSIFKVLTTGIICVDNKR